MTTLSWPMLLLWLVILFQVSADATHCTVSKVALTITHLWTVSSGLWRYAHGYQYFGRTYPQSTFSVPWRPQISYYTFVAFPRDKEDLSSWAWLMDISSHSLYLTSVAWDGDKWSNMVSQHQMHCNLNLKDEAQNLVWLKIYNNSFQD